MDFFDSVSPFLPQNIRMFLRILYSGLDNKRFFKAIAERHIGGLNRDNINLFFERLDCVEQEAKNVASGIFLDKEFMIKILGINPDESDLALIREIQDNGDRHNRQALESSKFVRFSMVLEEFGLKEITENEWCRIWNYVINKLDLEETKSCWHPDSGETCNKIIAAHSIQEAKWLKFIANSKSEVEPLPMFKTRRDKNTINYKSVFYGLCGKHDKMFNPIEISDYCRTEEQHFLYAYRAFLYSSHRLLKYRHLYSSGVQFEKDILNNKALLDEALLNKNYGFITTDIITLPYYPIVGTGAFSLYLNFLGKEIKHSKDRNGKIFLTILPDKNSCTTIILISYFEMDKPLYSSIVRQMNSRRIQKLDLSRLIIGHLDNVYFNPDYYRQFISKQESTMFDYLEEVQFDYRPFGSDEVMVLTQPDYLKSSRHDLNLFRD
jgi:hypothetical protein